MFLPGSGATDEQRRQAPWTAAFMTACLAGLILLGGCSGLAPTPEQIKTDDKDAKAAQLMRIATATRRGGDLASATGLYVRAHRMAPGWSAPLIELGETYLAMNALSEAEAAFAKAERLDPDGPRTRLGLGQTRLRAGKFAEALVQFNAAISAAPKDGRGYNGAGVALDLLGRQDEAQRRYMAGIEKEPGRTSLRNNLGVSLALAGNYAEAISLLGNLVREGKADARTRQNLALVYGLEGNMEKAAEIGRMDLTPAAVRNNLAFYERLRRMGDQERAAAIHGLTQPPPPKP